MRILAVDDDYASRLKLKATLASYGDVDTASDGELAIVMFEKAHKEGVPYDLVTMDIGLPDMRGQEVVERFRAIELDLQVNTLESEAKILMVTGMKDPKNIFSSFRQGCEGYLMKPVTAKSLREAIEKLIATGVAEG